MKMIWMAGLMVFTMAAGVMTSAISHAAPAPGQAPIDVAKRAFFSTLAPLCGKRDSAWGDKLLQIVAADVQYDQPMHGTGMFSYPEDGYFDRSLGEVTMAARAGTLLFERFGKEACVLASDFIIESLDFKIPDTNPQRLLPPPTTGSFGLVDAAWLEENTRLAGKCGIRNAAWVKDAKQGVYVAILTESEPSPAEREKDPTKLATNLRYGAGARIMASAIADDELSSLRKAACTWGKTATALTRIDALAKEWRDIQTRWRKGDFSGLGGKD